MAGTSHQNKKVRGGVGACSGASGFYFLYQHVGRTAQSKLCDFIREPCICRMKFLKKNLEDMLLFIF